MNSLTQTLLKYTAPGVPDMYQGGEIWDYSLVDPDNRRPVDYALRSKLLKKVKTASAAQVMERFDDVRDAGLPKLWVVKQALTVRDEHPEWFGAKAAYAPVSAKGTESDRVIAYQRGKDVLVVAPRWTHEAKGWGETSVKIPAGSWRNRMTNEAVSGGAVKVGELFAGFPVALLTRES